MKDPERLVDDESAILRSLLRAAIDDPAPPFAARRALASLGVAASAAGSSATAAKMGTSGASSGPAATLATGGGKPFLLVASGVTKWVVGASLVSGLAALSATELRRGAAPDRTPSVTATRPHAAVAAAPTQAAVATAAVAAASPSSAVAPPERPPVDARRGAGPTADSSASRSAPGVGPPRDPVSDEVGLLDAVRSALAGGAARRAVALLDAHDLRYPKSGFGPELVVLRVEALSRSGRAAEARSIARSYLAQSPGGPYAERLRKLAGP